MAYKESITGIYSGSNTFWRHYKVILLKSPHAQFLESVTKSLSCTFLLHFVDGINLSAMLDLSLSQHLPPFLNVISTKAGILVCFIYCCIQSPCSSDRQIPREQAGGDWIGLRDTVILHPQNYRAAYALEKFSGLVQVENALKTSELFSGE